MRTKPIALLLPFFLCGAAPFFAQPPQNPSPAPAKPPAAAPPAAQEPQAQKSQTTIPVTVNLVDVLFTVLDRRNKLVADLGEKDFKVFVSAVILDRNSQICFHKDMATEMVMKTNHARSRARPVV